MGLEHFLVMFPSAMLIAKLSNTVWGSVIELPTILFACGFGTLLFAFLTQRKVPFFLGPSFSYIGFVSYQVSQISGVTDIDEIRATIYYGYLLAGIMLFLLCWIYRKERARQIINTIFPPTIMGPAISLIGLELADMAVQDSGFSSGSNEIRILAIVTLMFIIIFSLLKHRFLQNASILLGVLVGCITATIMGHVSWPDVRAFSVKIPEFHFQCLTNPPQKWLALALTVFPCSVILFIESIGRIAVYEGMLRRDDENVDANLLNNSMSIHAVANAITGLACMLPSAIYAENLAIMNLHAAELSTKRQIEKDDDPFIVNCYSTYSIYPYIVASSISIVVACFSSLQKVFLAIPLPVFGGMELFVFALISAPGIQMLVEQQVNYKKISNQIITSSVLLAGISDISIVYDTLTLRGMSLGLLIGVIVNTITLILEYFGYLNERFALHEILDRCSENLTGKISINLYNEDLKHVNTLDVEHEEFRRTIRTNECIQILGKAHRIEMYDTRRKKIVLQQDRGQFTLRISLSKSQYSQLKNDYQKITIIGESYGMYAVVLDEHVSKRILDLLLKMATSK